LILDYIEYEAFFLSALFLQNDFPPLPLPAGRFSKKIFFGKKIFANLSADGESKKCEALKT
jgi:hypothetical protein